MSFLKNKGKNQKISSSTLAQDSLTLSSSEWRSHASNSFCKSSYIFCGKMISQQKAAASETNSASNSYGMQTTWNISFLKDEKVYV
jgi:hypothetical protein